MTTSANPLTGTPRERLQPFLLAVPFTTVVTGLFNLSDLMPVPLALAVGAGWGIVLGLVVNRLDRKSVVSAWLEDGFVFLGTVAMAFAACGGVLGLLMLRAALDSSSLTGETLVLMFLPAIPYYIAANAPMELLIVPALLFLGWRAGKRRILIVVAAGLFFALRVWSYLVFIPGRLSFAETELSTETLTAAERQQAARDLMVDDSRWILVLVIFVVLLLASHFPRLREQRATTVTTDSVA